jgi:hypothetical protein
VSTGDGRRWQRESAGGDFKGLRVYREVGGHAGPTSRKLFLKKKIKGNIFSPAIVASKVKGEELFEGDARRRSHCGVGARPERRG